MEAIILAGGLGTRLQGVIGQHPKCMAPINGKPFLAYMLDYLDRQGCTRAIVSLGYKHNVVIKWLESQQLFFELDVVIEDEPLGTGGGILAAMEEAESEDVAVLNGDTMFMADLKAQMKFHLSNKAACTLGLKEMKNFDRYGVVNTNEAGIITSFEEKKQRESGMINGGIYMLNRDAFLEKDFANKFSFEKEYLEKYTNENKFYALESKAYFIDIGIPEDYTRAQEDFKTIFE